MSTTDGTKSAGKSGRRKGKAKAEQPRKAISPDSSPESPPTAQQQSPKQDQKLQPRPQPDHAESPKPDAQPAVEQPVAAIAASPDPLPAASLPPAEPALAQPSPSDPASAEPVSAIPPAAEPTPTEAAPAEVAPVSLQTIANAYRDYTRKSIEEFGSFVEQLSGVRSLDKAMTVQSEFVKRAYETSVAESQKICELHNRLARQTLDPFKGLAAKTPAPRDKS